MYIYMYRYLYLYLHIYKIICIPSLLRHLAVGRQADHVIRQQRVVRVVGHEHGGAAPLLEESGHALAHQVRSNLGTKRAKD